MVDVSTVRQETADVPEEQEETPPKRFGRFHDDPVEREAEAVRELIDEAEADGPARAGRGHGAPRPRPVDLGKRGEEAAARYLLRRGYEIEARNWTCPAGEADIIARDGDAVVFVEVKARSSYDKGLPEEAVGPQKRQRYERIAGYYLSQCSYCDVPVRFDVVALTIIAPDRALIRHHINAFGAA